MTSDQRFGRRPASQELEVRTIMTRVTWIVLGAMVSVALGVSMFSLAAHSNVEAQTVQTESQTMAPPVPQPALKAAPATPIAEKKAELGDDETWDPSWDAMIENALPVDLLSPKVAKAVKPFCPKFTSLNEGDKRAFWAYFFQALAGAEAGLVPTRDVRHTDPQLAVVDDVTHRMVRQQGLLQLTYMDQERYGCDFDWEKDKNLAEHDPAKTILQPRNNLLCGVNIIHNQLIEQHKPLLSSTSYFSTLQPGTISVKVFLKQMANVPAVCGRRPVRQERDDERAREAAAVNRTESPAPSSYVARSAGGSQ
jgi:hypothetical protein